ncbi:MAG: peptidase [Pseudomonadota bacterium]
MSALARFSFAAAAATFVLAPASAQNVNLDPSYGTINLQAGFSDDPRLVELSSGGSVDASTISSSCRGYIANAPDVRVFYSSGSLPLMFSVAAEADTTLVINAPNGRWYCNDDGGSGLNPAIRFDNPGSGRYEVWVGTYGSASLRSAILGISELYDDISARSSSGGGGSGGRPDFSLDPNYGTARLRSGFTPDPHRVRLQSGGSIDASVLGSPCRGYVSRAPDYRVDYTSGRLPLNISVQSSADTTLVVNGPSGNWYCDDDSGGGLNPSIRFDTPRSGQYDVWVGTYGSARLESAILDISELYSN